MNDFSFPHSLLGPHRQSNRLLRLHTPLAPDLLLAERVQIDERIGPCADDSGTPGAGHSGCRLDITALSPDTHLELKALLGQPVLLELLTQDSRTELRPWHGHVTDAALLGSDGGLARYRLVVQPWMAFLAHRTDSRVFQGLSVPAIIDTVFAGYSGQGRLAPAWRWDLADASVYPERSLCIQYQESDLAFVQRLMLEEGLFGWWEHSGAPDTPDLGLHEFVIADHNGALTDNPQPRVRYTQSHVSLPVDSLTRWQRARSVQAGALTLASRDVRSLSLRDCAEAAIEGGPGELALHDVPGTYAYESRTQGERLARVQMQAIEAHRERVRASGPWRRAAVATRFTLTDHPVHDGSDAARDGFVILGVEHRARNNLSADQQAAIDALLGAPEREPGSPGANASDEPLHECHLLAQPARLAVRACALDERALPDARLCPRPLLRGVQTAVVVGCAEPLHTERDHRIKVQFHWQRGSRSSHRLDSPEAERAPASDGSYTWVRVAEQAAGANWGSVFTPRLGQEVLVAFSGGDIDRPVVLGSLYNGRGVANAQGNQVLTGAATSVGSAPAWFPGSAPQGRWPAHAHNQVLTGYKSQELAASASGLAGCNQLVFDDTAGQGRVELSSTSARTRLQLGHLRHQIDNRRLNTRGHGLDLASAAWGAVRAGRGLLVSAWRLPPSTHTARALDAHAAITTLDEATALTHTLARSAQVHRARLSGEPELAAEPPKPDAAPGAPLLPAQRGQHASLASLRTTDTTEGASGDAQSVGGGHGCVDAWARPDLLATAPAGITAHTPASATLTSAATTSCTTTGHSHTLAQRHLASASAHGLMLYTYGQRAPSNTGPGTSPITPTGIAIHAASGNWQSQSQSAPTRIAAQRRVRISSTRGKVTLAAPNHVLLAAAGAAIHMHGGAITCTGPGSIYFKASLKVFNSPGARVAYAFADLPKPGEIPPNRLVVTHLYHDNDPVQGADYEATFSDGSTRTGRTSRAGTVTLEDVPPGAVNIRFGPDCRPYTPVPPDPNPDHRPALGTGDWDALAAKHGEPQ